LILPVDLPLIQSADIAEIGALGDRHSFIICPDKNLTGTNALLLPSKMPIRFKFGEDSYRRHQIEARRCGIAPFLHFNGRIAQDVDYPDDLAILDGAQARLRSSPGDIRLEMPGQPAPRP
jgi:2-phospho-L-lactate guanylyltransferase (CobY/MobA/RfbA family)